MAPFIFISQQSYNEELIEISSNKKKIKFASVKANGIYIERNTLSLSLSRTYTKKCTTEIS